MLIFSGGHSGEPNPIISSPGLRSCTTMKLVFIKCIQCLILARSCYSSLVLSSRFRFAGFTEAFRQCDESDDGSIATSDVSKLLTSLGRHMTRAETMDVIDDLDPTGSEIAP